MPLAHTGFDTERRGAPEAAWRAWIDSAPTWQPSRGPLVVVAPHPDDETLGAGGLIATWREHGWPVTLIAVTDGEAACPEIHDLAQVRRGERAQAMHVLGGSDIAVVELHLPDGGVAAEEDRLVELLAPYINGVGWLVAPFEEDGHCDHDAVGRACALLAKRTGVAFARYPVWAWHRGSAELRACRDVVRFPLSEAARAAKRGAISQFRSQLEERAGGAIVPAHVLEYFDRPYEVFVL